MAEPSNIVRGEKSRITWNAANATSCLVQGSTGNSPVPLSGSEETALLTENQTLTFVCSGPGGTVVQSVVIAVAQKAPGPLSVSIPSSVGSYRIGGTLAINLTLRDSSLAEKNTLALFLVGTGNNLFNGRITYFPGGTFGATSTYEWNIRNVSFGDANNAVVPGTYKVRAILYEGRNICFGFCGQNSEANVSPLRVVDTHETGPVILIEEAVPSGDVASPYLPANLAVSSSTPSRIIISWDPSYDNIGVTAYGVYRDEIFLGTTKERTYADKNLSANTSYEYWVGAYDAAGNASPLVKIIAKTKLPNADITPPGAPTKLRATAVLSNEITLAWSPAKDNVGVTAYTIYRNDEKIATIRAFEGKTNEYLDSKISTSTTYTYRVRAVDGGENEGSPSNQIRVLTSSELPPAIILFADPPELSVSRPTANIVWYTERANSCRASGDWRGGKPLFGTTTVKFLSPTKIYALTCTGLGGPITKSVTVYAALPPPSVFFTATSTFLRYRESAKITWKTERANSCVASGDWSGKRGVSGTVSTGPVTSNRTYTLTCFGETGTTTERANFIVGPATTVASVEPNTITLPKDNALSVSWTYSSTNTSYCRVTQNGTSLNHPKTGSVDWPASGIVTEIGSKLRFAQGVVRVFTCYNGKGVGSNPAVTALNVVIN